MIDEQKIRIMTELAIYDKRYGALDKKSNSFFRNDYVYWKNFWVRLYALLGCAILAGLYVMHKLVIEQTDLFSIDYRQEGVRILIFALIVLCIATFFGTIKATRQYTKTQKRIKHHLELTKKLDEMNRRADIETLPEGDSLVYYGTTDRNKRNPH